MAVASMPTRLQLICNFNCNCNCNTPHTSAATSHGHVKISSLKTTPPAIAFGLASWFPTKHHVHAPKASSIDDAAEDGVSLGTMKLPGNIDVARFESLLFQWGNSLFQGASIPLPMPLKVDKIPGGVRLGFINIEDGKTEVLVYIDLLVFPATSGSVPMFRAIRNGRMKDKALPGEPRIMTSLLEALKKSVEIARL